jgi:hypothetical protein
LLHHIVAAGIDRVGGAQLEGQRELLRHDIDRHQWVRTDQRRAEQR